MASKKQYPVYSLTGQVLDLLSDEEKNYYEEAQRKYTSENSFKDASDLRALERLIMFEVLIFRYQGYLASGTGPDGPLVVSEEANYHKQLKELAITVGNLQKELGLLKTQRDKERFDTIGAYINDLLVRAEEFGVNRENMLDKAMELTMELFAKVGAFKRANDKERHIMGMDNADVIVDWIHDYMEPEFNKVDEHFQNTQQKYWVRKL